VWAIVKYVSCSNWYRYRINIGKGDIDPSLMCLVTVPVYSDATQLNSTSSWVELRRYRHPHRRNSTVADDRQCNWPSRTAYSQSARSRSVVFFPHNSINFLQILHTKIPSPGKLVKTRHIWRHDLQTKSTGSRRSELIGDSNVHAVNVSTTRRRVELCRYKRALTRRRTSSKLGSGTHGNGWPFSTV